MKKTIFLSLFIILAISIVFTNYNFSETIVGSDYAYYLPFLIINKSHFFSGDFVPSLFTSKVCGGFVDFANPQNIFYSFKQIIFNFTNITYFFSLTLFFYSSVGFIGSYLLLNKIFFCNKINSVIGGFLFAFNGFYLSRFLIGHLGFLEFTILPLFIYLIIKSFNSSDKYHSRKFLLFAIFIIAYLIYSGSISIFPYFLISAFAVLIIYFDFHQFNLKLLRKFIVVTLFGLLLACHKIYLTFQLFSNIPRNLSYIAIDNPFGVIKFLINGIFGNIFFHNGNLYQNGFSIGWHEFSYAVGFLSTIMLVMALFNKDFLNKYKISLLGIALGFLIITLISTSSKFYELLLVDQITVIPWRFLSVLILPIIILSVLGSNIILEKNFSYKILIVISFLFIGLQLTSISKSFYGDYKIQNQHLSFNTQPIKYIAAFTNQQDNNLAFPLMRNDLIFNHASVLNCYEPLHGYRNEKMDLTKFKFNEIKKFPEVNILLGNPLELGNNMTNFYDPSCFLFPHENQCEPYDHFDLNNLENLKKLINGGNYEYNAPVLNSLLLTLNIILILSSVLYLLYLKIRKIIC